MITDVDTDIAYILLLLQTIRGQSRGPLGSSPNPGKRLYSKRTCTYVESNK